MSVLKIVHNQSQIQNGIDNISSSPQSGHHSWGLGFVRWIEGKGPHSQKITYSLMAAVCRNVEQSNIQKKKNVDKDIFDNTFKRYH